MAEPTSSLSVSDLVKRVAIAAKVAYHGSDGQGRAMVPVNDYDLDKCLRCVNDGIRLFIRSGPLEGGAWRWQRRQAEVTFASVYETGTADSATSTTVVDLTLADTYDTDDDLLGYYCYITGGTGEGSWAQITGYTALTGTITVADWLDEYGNPGGTDPDTASTFSVTDVETVKGDPTRYVLPQDFQGNVTGRITYDQDSNRGHIIQWTGEAEIRSEQEISVFTGYPTRAAVRPYGRRRWELFVNREPSAADTVIFPYEKGFDDLELVAGTYSNGSATTLVDSSLANLYPDDYFNGWSVYITDGSGKNARAVVTDYTGSTGTFTVADWLGADGVTSSDADPDSSGGAFYVEDTYRRHPAGMAFDEAVKSACLAQCEMEFDDVQGGYMDKFLKFDLPNAIRQDLRSAPRRLGLITGPTPPEREWKDVEYI